MKTFKQFCEGKTQLYGLSIKELLDTVLNFNGKTLIYFDTETMGLTPKKDYLQLTEIAAVAYDGSTFKEVDKIDYKVNLCLLYTSPSPRDGLLSRMPSSA